MFKPLNPDKKPLPATDFKKNLSFSMFPPGYYVTPETMDKLLALHLVDLYRSENSQRYREALKTVLENYLSLTAFDALEDAA